MVHGDMKFYNLKDFCNKADYIKKRYGTLGLQEKVDYKMYVYSNCFMNGRIIDKIWEYLNEPLGSCYYVSLHTLVNSSRR